MAFLLPFTFLLSPSYPCLRHPKNYAWNWKRLVHVAQLFVISSLFAQLSPQLESPSTGIDFHRGAALGSKKKSRIQKGTAVSAAQQAISPTIDPHRTAEIKTRDRKRTEVEDAPGSRRLDAKDGFSISSARSRLKPKTQMIKPDSELSLPVNRNTKANSVLSSVTLNGFGSPATKQIICQPQRSSNGTISHLAVL